MKHNSSFATILMLSPIEPPRPHPQLHVVPRLSNAHYYSYSPISQPFFPIPLIPTLLPFRIYSPIAPIPYYKVCRIKTITPLSLFPY